MCSSFLVTVTTDSIQFGHFYDDHLRVPYLTYFRLICKIQGIESNGTVLSLGEETLRNSAVIMVLYTTMQVSPMPSQLKPLCTFNAIVMSACVRVPAVCDVCMCCVRSEVTSVFRQGLRKFKEKGKGREKKSTGLEGDPSLALGKICPERSLLRAMWTPRGHAVAFFCPVCRI